MTAMRSLFHIAAGACLCGTVGAATVSPPDTGLPLANPGMGWVFHHYDNSIDGYGPVHGPGYDGSHFPGLNVVYLRLAWSYLEPEEGVFNWSLVDTPAQRYLRRGCQVAFRFTTFESGVRDATPGWVYDAGARGAWWRDGQGPSTEADPKACREPDYEDPVFLAKLEGFLRAAGARYDGNPSVAFIDIGSIGIWGEGNPVSRTYPASMYRTHIDMHRRCFPGTLLVAMDDWGPTTEDLDFGAPGARTAAFRIRVPDAYRGRPLHVRAGLWIPGAGGRDLPEGRLLPAEGLPDRRVDLGVLAVSPEGVPTFVPSESGGAAGTDPDFRLRARGFAEGSSDTLVCDLEILRGMPEGVRPFCHVGDETRDIVCNAGQVPDPANHPALYARSLGATLRDDSIMWREGVTYESDGLARLFPADRPIVIESGHYAANDWGDGTTYLRAVEDYRASFVSIHGNPFTILSDHPEIIDRINRRLGYRLHPAEVGWPERIPSDAPFTVRMAWRNLGVAPCAVEAYPCLTLKRPPDGALAAVLTDEGLDLRDLPPGPPGEAPAFVREVRFSLPSHIETGSYDVYVSAGRRDGTPLLRLPLAGEDGEMRYRLGTAEVTRTGEYTMEFGPPEKRDGKAVLPVVFRVSKRLPEGVRPFAHVDVKGRIAAGLPVVLPDLPAEGIREPGAYAGHCVLDVSAEVLAEDPGLFIGLWVFEGRRIVPANGGGDLRVRVGTLAAGADGLPTAVPPAGP